MTLNRFSWGIELHHEQTDTAKKKKRVNQQAVNPLL